jgi:cephalosporin-C deacetylase
MLPDLDEQGLLAYRSAVVDPVDFDDFWRTTLREARRHDLDAVVARVPFRCDIRRASRITDAMPYKELGRYLAVHRDAASGVFRTLSYFDGVSFARRITAPAFLSAALMDPTCPPSTVYGAFHELRGPKEIVLWDYNGHEGGGHDDDERAVKALGRVMA